MENVVIEDQVREDIAFIRRAVEQGSAYATARGPDMLIWGISIAIGYLGTYGFVRDRSPAAPGALWAACLGLPWLFLLSRVARSLAGRADGAGAGDAAVRLRHLSDDIRDRGHGNR